MQQMDYVQSLKLPAVIKGVREQHGEKDRVKPRSAPLFGVCDPDWGCLSERKIYKIEDQ